MNETRQLRDTWIEFIRKLQPFGGRNPPGFKQRANIFLNVYQATVIDRVRRLVPENLHGRLEEEFSQAMDQIANAEGNPIKQISAEYKRLYEAYSDLRDERRQQDWATTWDNIKLFTWRSAQGVMIALIVLGTAYTAKELDLALPLFRVIP